MCQCNVTIKQCDKESKVQKLTGANKTPLKILPFTAAVISNPESKAPSTFPRTSAPI